MSDSQAIPDLVLKAQALAAGRISRRDFLRSAGRLGISASAASVLAACANATTVAPAATSAPAVNTGAKLKVRYLSWWFEEGNRGKTWKAFIKEF